MAFFATLVLVVLSIIRPAEIWPFLEPLHLLDLCILLAVVGVTFDVATGKEKDLGSPQLVFLLGFIVTSYTSSIKAVGFEGFKMATLRTVISAVFMLIVMYGTRTLQRLRTLIVLLILMCVFVSAVAVHQGSQTPTCIELPPDAEDIGSVENDEINSDGRECETPSECYRNGGRGDVEYACEAEGLFKTVTIVRRVRWRGQLADPNELSVYIGVCVPFMLMMIGTRRRWLRAPVALAAIGLGLWAIVLSKSRGGQLVTAAVFAPYFLARYRWKGLVVGALAAAPMFFLGGREDSEGSAEERTELLYNGVTYVAHHPFFGMGLEQFAEMEGHTAHNSYLLAAAEMGMPGFFAWTGLMWASIKIPLTVARRPAGTFEPGLRELSTALVVSFVGMSVGIFFLSFTFKQLLFVWLGMSGAVYGIARKQDPAFSVKLGRRDLVGLFVFDVLVLVAIYVYTRFKAGAG